MRHRLAVVVVAVLVTTALAPAQPVGTYSKAVPPDKAVLDRLNLKTEWTQFLPVEGNRDALTQIQTLDDQVFVQTRAGLLVAIDARSGRIQWAARLGNGSYGNSYPVAANSQFVFVSHVTKLYAFYRYTGITEFVAELGSPPTVGLAADERSVYCVLGMRSGGAGAHRVAVYDMPRPIVVTEPSRAAIDPLAQGAGRAAANSPVDDLVKRYSAVGIVAPEVERLETPYRPNVLSAPIGGMTGGRSPSLATLGSMTPPYDLGNRAAAPSMSIVPSMVQPFHLRAPSSKYIQQTPSLSTIPPSVAAALQLTDLRPKMVEPPMRWEFGMNARVLYPLVLTPTRVWAVTEGNVVLALNKLSEPGKVVTELSERLTSPVAAAPVASGVTHYIPLGNGTLAAADAVGGNLSGGVVLKWRAVPGGINNHSPFVTKDYVYAAGDDSGVVCIGRDEGNIVWRSDDNADRIIGATEELVYVRDRQGRFLVYDARRPTDPARKRSVPLGSANLSEFNVNVVNTASDRVYLAADNGLLVCVRDASPKYIKPVVIWPPADVNPAKRVGVEGQGGVGVNPKKNPEPKDP